MAGAPRRVFSHRLLSVRRSSPDKPFGHSHSLWLVIAGRWHHLKVVFLSQTQQPRDIQRPRLRKGPLLRRLTKLLDELLESSRRSEHEHPRRAGPVYLEAVDNILWRKDERPCNGLEGPVAAPEVDRPLQDVPCLVLRVVYVRGRQLTWRKEVLEDGPSVIGVLSRRLHRDETINEPARLTFVFRKSKWRFRDFGFFHRF